MKFPNQTLVLAILATFFIVCPILAAEQNKTASNDIYFDLQDIKSFGFIRVILKGDDAKKIGLNEAELTDFLRLKFKNNFANITYKYQDIWDFLDDEKNAQTIGRLLLSIWIVGDNYPIAYHMEIEAGTFNILRIYTNAVLGYGSKDSVPDTIRDQIGKLVEKFAIVFFKSRGEL